MAENKPAKKASSVINIVVTILISLTLPRVGKAVAMIICAALLAVTLTTLSVSLMYRESVQDITLGQKRLLALHAAVKKFQSEQYFSRVPQNLRELAEPPVREIIFNGKPLTLAPLPLLENPAAFALPERNLPADGVSDFWFVPYYELFLPANAIILLDRPGNYSDGGNVVFNSGKIQFLTMTDRDYARFADAVMSRQDRDFVRQKSADCSLAGFKE